MEAVGYKPCAADRVEERTGSRGIIAGRAGLEEGKEGIPGRAASRAMIRRDEM